VKCKEGCSWRGREAGKDEEPRVPSDICGGFRCEPLVEQQVKKNFIMAWEVDEGKLRKGSCSTGKKKRAISPISLGEKTLLGRRGWADVGADYGGEGQRGAAD